MEVAGDDYRIVDEGRGMYAIGKQEFPLTGSTSSGIFKYLKTGGASFIKIVQFDESLTGMTRGQFIEVRDTFLITVISWGTCKF